MGDAEPGAPGALYLFLGAAPGVGKTVTMLRRARTLKANGVDVVIGFLERHERPETLREAAGLEIVPPLKVVYRGATYDEVDLDALVARRPAIAVIDELAHANTPGTRFAKRYQDVEFLLDRGIGVMTAVNIQHFEHVAEEAAAIIGQPVRETIPREFLERAAEVEIVDLSPDMLRQRLKDGLVVPPEQVPYALDHYFRPEVLSALREMLLREVAEQVDARLKQQREGRGADVPLGAREVVLVAVGYVERAEALLSRGRRMADRMKARIVAVTVTNETEDQMGARERQALDRLRALATRMGIPLLVEPRRYRSVGEVVWTVAVREEATVIVVGQPRPRGWLVRREDPVRYLLRRLRYVDLRIVGWRA
jgi:two-component system sensor histidine kinase KdpD